MPMMVPVLPFVMSSYSACFKTFLYIQVFASAYSETNVLTETCLIALTSQGGIIYASMKHLFCMNDLANL